MRNGKARAGMVTEQALHLRQLQLLFSWRIVTTGGWGGKGLQDRLQVQGLCSPRAESWLCPSQQVAQWRAGKGGLQPGK